MLEERTKAYRRLRLTLPTSAAGNAADPAADSVSHTDDGLTQTSVAVGGAQTYVLVPVLEEAPSGVGGPSRTGSPARFWGIAAAAVLLGAVGIVLGGASVGRAASQAGASAGAGSLVRPAAAAPAPPTPAKADFLGTPVAAGADGQLLLEPRDGATHGDGIHQGDGDIGYWNSPSAYVTWVADTRAAGPYAIQLTYACGDGCGGDFEVTIGRQHFKSRSSSTGGWDRYQSARVGLAKLPKGRVLVTVRPIGPVQTALMSLQRVKLYPASLSAAPPEKPAVPAADPVGTAPG